MSKSNALVLIAIIILAGLGFFILKLPGAVTEKPLITNFEECAKAGYPVMESYPRQCRVSGGELFVESIKNPNPDPIPVVKGGCFVGGCSSQICSDQKDVASTCEYKEEYACYQTATCERQTSGECGWTPTSQLSSCLNSSSRIAAGYVSGHVDIGPFCPVEIAGTPCKVPPEAYTSRSVIIYDSNGRTINVKGKLDAQGNYKIAVGPGKYFVQIDPAGIGPGEKKPATVKSFETTVVDFDIDTGIR